MTPVTVADLARPGSVSNDSHVGRTPAVSNYVFRSTWRLDASPERVFDALADVERYPTWWPQVRATRRIDEISGEVTCRNLLPYDLTFTMVRGVEDRNSRVLRADVTGGLVGTSQWTISADHEGALAVFDEDVAVGQSVLRATGPLLRPAFKASHAHMMSAGEQGLRSHLSARGLLSRG